MKRQTLKFFLAVAVVFSGLSIAAQAGYVDVTINDGTSHSTYGSDPRAGVGESGSVAANCVASPIWDLRAFAFDSSTNQLLVVSGFNPNVKLDIGQNPLPAGIGIGDIFIDTNNSFSVPSHSSNGFLTYANSSVGFEYAIDLLDPWTTTNSINYNIVSLAGNSVLKSGYYAQNASSDPAFLQSLGSGSVLSSGTSSVSVMSDAQVFSNLGINVGTNGGNNYVFSFTLPGQITSTSATYRLGEECGNDLLVGRTLAVAAVPETSTWVMGFLAVGAVGFMVRRSRQISA